MVRLGIWQLDRLEVRRAFNAEVSSAIAAPEVELTEKTLPELPMAYQKVFATGEYDLSQQVIIRNQALQGRPGYDLLTPLLLDQANTAVMVNRGWFPVDQLSDLPTMYPQPGRIVVAGIVRDAEIEPDFGGRRDPTLTPGEKRDAWSQPNILAMDQQVTYDLLPFYIQEAPTKNLEADSGIYPIPHIFEPELTEGPHLGYAFQWFLFALILLIGYPIFVARESAS